MYMYIYIYIYIYIYTAIKPRGDKEFGGSGGREPTGQPTSQRAMAGNESRGGDRRAAVATSLSGASAGREAGDTARASSSVYSSLPKPKVATMWRPDMGMYPMPQ